MTDFAGGYAVKWQLTRVDPDTWADAGEVAGLAGASVSRSCEDDVPLLESGTLDLDGAWDGPEAWLRLWAVADDGAWERHAIATLLCSCASERRERGGVTCELSGRSALAPCADERLARGEYAPAGCDGAAFAARLVARSTPAPVDVEGSFELTDHYVFDLGSTVLEAAWQVLDAGGFCMQVDGMGRVRIGPRPTEPALTLSKAGARLLMDGSKRVLDVSGVPNRYYAVDGSETAVAVNESDPHWADPERPSDTSHAARGRWVDAVDEAPVLVGGETLSAYARRKLAEARTLVRTCEYEREYVPGVHPFSLVAGSFPQLGIEGPLRVLSQELEIGRGVTVRETAGMEVTV